MSISSVTPMQAYLAAYEFLLELYLRTDSDEVGGRLSEMSFLSDGKPADPAVWDDWMHCVKKAVAGDVDASMKWK
jgi:hypothetical protein